MIGKQWQLKIVMVSLFICHKYFLEVLHVPGTCASKQVRGYQIAKNQPLLEEPSPKSWPAHTPYSTCRTSLDFEKIKPGVIKSEPKLRYKDTETPPGMPGGAIGSYEDMAR